MVQFDGTVAATITLVVGVLGCIINVNVGLAVRRCRKFGYAFGMLCLSQTIANVGNCLVFAVMASGITLINPEWHYTYVGRRLGQLLIFFWEVTIFSHLFISANRGIAVSFPTKYNRFFSDRNITKILVGTIWLLSALQATPYAFPICSQQFDPVSFTLAYAEGWCGELTAKYGDLTVSLIVVACITFLDIASFIRLYQLRKSNTDCGVRTNEIRLFFQVQTITDILLMRNLGLRAKRYPYVL